MSDTQSQQDWLAQLIESVELEKGDGDEPVDRDMIAQFVRKELDKDDEKLVLWHASRFEDWRNAVLEALGDPAIRGETRLVELRKPQSRYRSAIGIAMALAACLLIAFFVYPRGPGGLRDGGLVVAMRDGKVSGLDAYAEDLREQAAAALAGEAPQPASIARLSANIPVVRDPNRQPSSAILHPYGTAVRSARPELAWEPLDVAEGYRIEVYSGNEDAIAVAAEVAEPRWTPDVPLERGQAYRWQVVYVTGEGEFVAPRADERPAVFSVIEESQLAEVEQAEASVGDSELLLGVVAYEAGLLDEAESHWRRLLESNPDNPLAQSLLENIERARKPKEP